MQVSRKWEGFSWLRTEWSGLLLCHGFLVEMNVSVELVLSTGS
jgi:hypothetical protein